MKIIDRQSVKNTFSHTWYIYPVAAAVISLLWVWGYQAIHLPSDHQIINIFFSTNINDDSFKKTIETNFSKEDLRELNTYSCWPQVKDYYTVLNMRLANSDLLVLPERIMKEFGNDLDKIVVEINDSIIEKYLSESPSFFTVESKNYGLEIKEKGEACWLDEYMTFDDDSYYVALSRSSKNLGDVLDENNAKFDNALKVLGILEKGE
ncbi:MAG: hypothetical protein IJ247_05455 [Bacilli bacterium]|nr:hypothetical protein [Bacilli bacterium]